MNSKSEARLVASIRNGVAGTSMPAWGKVLNEAQVRDVLAYVETDLHQGTAARAEAARMSPTRIRWP